MSSQLRPLSLTADEILDKLVRDSLPNILGSPHKVIASNLPFEGNHILTLDAAQRPALVSYDGRDGGRALLTGLGVLEGLTENQAILCRRLYPGLFTKSGSDGPMFGIEDVRLITLSPTPPPGGAHLQRALPSLYPYTFRLLEVDGEIALLLEAPLPWAETAGTRGETAPAAPRATFRTGATALSAEEERYFAE
jgi:hypothetical protein